MARGNRQQIIFSDARDRRQFLKIVAVALRKFSAQCYGYCLMGNHYHLVVHTPRANLPNLMHCIDSCYARYVNWRHGTTGRLFESPYIAIVIEDTSYLRDAIAYVLRNPVAAGLVRSPELWPWSSYNATMGTAPALFLTLGWLSMLFASSDLQQARSLLAERVMDQPVGDDDRLHEIAEGTLGFKKQVRKVIGASLYRTRLPRAYRAIGRPTLSEVFAGTRRAERRTTILRAHVVHGYLLVEIAAYLELHPTTISRIVNQSGSYRLIRD